MDLHTAIRSRYSARRYKHRPVEEEQLQRVLEAGRLAPSARNDQEWRFVVVRDAETRCKLAEAAYGQAFLEQAPVVIAACAEHTGRVMGNGQLAHVVNVAIAIDHMALAATAEGLGTCWVCRFKEPRAKEALGIPQHGGIRVIALLTLGYADSEPPTGKDRLPMDAIVRYERW